MRINVGLISVLAAAMLLCSSCRPEPTANNAPATTSTPAWIVDHVAMSKSPSGSAPTYTAYCAPAVEFNPDGATDPGALAEVEVTESQFRRLHHGDACPGR